MIFPHESVPDATVWANEDTANYTDDGYYT